MFRCSRNNRIVQDALGHHSFSDSTGIFLFSRRSTPVKQIPSSYNSMLPEYISFMITDA